MLHLSSFQLVGGICSRSIKGTHFNLMYTSKKSKNLVKYGYVKSVCFCNNYVKKIILKNPSKFSNNKLMFKVDVKVVNVNYMR